MTVSRTAAPRASGPRRILGAVIPMDQGCYFLKATEIPERLEPLLKDFRSVVATFAIDPSSGKPQMELPAGWTMRPRNDIAMAEFLAPAEGGEVKFTVTVLGMPGASEWNDYLRSNINRWRGQLALPDLDATQMADELLSVQRPGNLLPGYVFDATGSGSGAMSGTPPMSGAPPVSSGSPGSVAPAANPPSPGDTPTSSPSAQPSATEPISSDASLAEPPPNPELKYALPEGWTAAPGTPFRLATFAIDPPQGSAHGSSEPAGEVTVSLAVDNPLANSQMWHQQVARAADEGQLKAWAESSIANAESIPCQLGTAKLYTIRNPDANAGQELLVVSMPSHRPDLSLFIKLRGDRALVQSQRENLIRFAESLTLQ